MVLLRGDDGGALGGNVEIPTNAGADGAREPFQPITRRQVFYIAGGSKGKASQITGYRHKGWVDLSMTQNCLVLWI